MKIKNNLYLKITFLFLCLFQYSFGQAVTIDEARHVAQNLMFEKANLPQTEFITSGETVGKKGEQVYYYTFNLKNSGGFVIVSANKKAYPVLAYSLHGNSKEGNHSPAFDGWINSYVTQMQQALNSKAVQDENTAKLWDKYLADFNDFTKTKSSKTIVDPLFGSDLNASSISYGQNGYYNDSCPGGSVVGCVATAMSQIMVYHDHPVVGVGYREYDHSIAEGYQNDFDTLIADFGSTTYNIALLPPNISAANAEVAQLCHHAGISVLMDYDPSGSSASTRDAAKALITNWNYNKYLEYRYKSKHTGVDEWEGMIRTEIDSGNPVIYRGEDASQGGHAWICDGYDDSNTSFHMNWGWDGSDNGYYLLTALNPSPYNFIIDQAAIFGIQPNASDTINIVWEEFDVDDSYFELSSDWNRDGDNDGQSYIGNTNGYNGSYAKTGNDGEIDQWLVSPKLGLPANHEISLSFYSNRLNSHNQGVEIYISTTGTDVTTDFTLIESYTITDSWEQYTADLSAYAGQKVYLGIKSTGDESSGFTYVFLDNLNIFAIPLISPTVTCQPATIVKAYSAVGNGHISDIGYPAATAHGMCWNTSGSPTLADSVIDNGAISDTGAFSNILPNLIPGTTYYVRAFATNTLGTVYSTEQTFTTVACDIDATAQADSMVTCYGENNGGASVSATGGTIPYIYSWSNSATTKAITGLVAGEYIITVSDTNDCFSIDTVEITQPEEISSTDSVTICRGEYFATPAGDTLFNITSTTVDESILTAANGCDSTIRTTILVKSVNVSVSIDGNTITATEDNADSYQWIDCGDNYSPITGETNYEFTATENGNYAVIIENNNCIDTSSCNTIIIEGIDNVSWVAGYIWPNPTTGQINIRTDKIDTPLEITIYDVGGRIILLKELPPKQTISIIELPVENGIYFIQLKSNSKTATYKVIKK